MNEPTPEEELRKIAEDATAPVSDADVSRARLVSQFVIFPVAIILVALAIYLGLGVVDGREKDRGGLSQYHSRGRHQQPVAGGL